MRTDLLISGAVPAVAGTRLMLNLQFWSLPGQYHISATLSIDRTK